MAGALGRPRDDRQRAIGRGHALRPDRIALVLGQRKAAELAENPPAPHLVHPLTGERGARALAAQLAVPGQRSDALAQEE